MTNQSFLLDLKLILATAVVVLFSKVNVVDLFFKQLPKRPF